MENKKHTTLALILLLLIYSGIMFTGGYVVGERVTIDKFQSNSDMSLKEFAESLNDTNDTDSYENNTTKSKNGEVNDYS